jgi:hypothetical protein
LGGGNAEQSGIDGVLLKPALLDPYPPLDPGALLNPDVLLDLDAPLNPDP